MTGIWLLLAVTLLLVSAAVTERIVHHRTLGRIPVRVHVNGTRGKSSVVRLVAAGLREAGKTVCAKTTGTLARMILPDGREVPIYRPSGPNVIEQKRIVAIAAAYGAEALVVECMALQPELQSLSESKLIRATHGVITNARPDHLEVMGPTDADVARALAGMIPAGGKLYTAEHVQLDILRAAAADRGAELVALDEDDFEAVTGEDLAGFDYTEHRDNVALALRICEDLGVAREAALRGMHGASPDPGALREYHLDFFGRRIVFFNGFAANDPVSTRQLWDLARSRAPEQARTIAIFNCRADRPERSLQLGEEFVKWQAPDFVVLMGTGTHVFARAATRAGFDPIRLVLVEDLGVDEIFERVVGLVDSSALIMGMGNSGGHGLDLARYFANRARPRGIAAPQEQRHA
jgi:poly-gamma-glutamate synthase PgsB/CapB